MSGAQKARSEMKSFARDIMALGGNLEISEEVATGVFGEQFTELVDIIDPGVKSEVTIKRAGKVVAKITIER